MGGLSWSTTKEMLYEEFAKYGELVDYIVMKNQETGQSRGFGFVTFQDQTAAENALRSGPHRVDGRSVTLKYVYFYYLFFMHMSITLGRSQVL